MKEVRGGCFGEILAKFYSDVFEWKSEHDLFNDYFSFKAGTKKTGIDGRIFTGKVPTHLTFHVRVGDIFGTVERVKRSGGQILREPLRISAGITVAVLKDSENNVVGVNQKKSLSSEK